MKTFIAMWGISRETVAVAMRQLTTLKDFGTIPQLEGQHLTETPMIHFSTIPSAFL